MPVDLTTTHDTYRIERISKMQRADLEGLIQSAKWVVPASRIDLYLKIGQTFGYFHSNGPIRGCITLFEWQPNLFSVANLIVDPNSQRQGIGRRLLQSAMDQAQGATLQLIATEEGFPLYQQMGFDITHQVARMERGPIKHHAQTWPNEAVNAIPFRQLSDRQIDQLVAIDQSFVGASRSALWHALQRTENTWLVCARDSEDEFECVVFTLEDQVLRVGPVLARSVEKSCELLNAAIQGYPNTVRLDVLTDYPELIEYATTAHQFTVQRYSRQMAWAHPLTGDLGAHPHMPIALYDPAIL